MVGAGDGLAFLGLEDDILDRFYLRRRTAKAALNQVTIHVGYAPFLNIQLRAGLVQFRVAKSRRTVLVTGGLLGPFLFTHGVFVLLYQLRVAGTAGSGGRGGRPA